jgi:hypothetical protein
MTINFDAADPFYSATCWDSRGFTDYCSLTDEAKCSLNGTKGKGTTGKGATSKWYDGVNKTHTGGPGSTLPRPIRTPCLHFVVCSAVDGLASVDP